MPIVKRTAKPEPLENILKELNRRVSDYEWDEDFVNANAYRVKADEVRKRIDAGELYGVMP